MAQRGPGAGIVLGQEILRSAPSLVDILRWRAHYEPDRCACTFLDDGDEPHDQVTYGSLDRQARIIADCLLNRGEPGDRALLLHPSGLDFLAALLGCFYAGIIAVPLYPPKLNRRDDRLLDVSRNAGARLALTTSSVRAGLDRALRHTPELEALDWIVTEETVARAPIDISDAYAAPDPNAVAYLQYTSGSTRSPKGVMVSHGNLLANIEDIDSGFQHGDDSVSVSWLPHFHDMGLVYGLLAPLALGFPCYFMPPASFLQRPLRWLKAISRFGATHSGGPNFAYDLCTQRITAEQKHGLDLSRWVVAFNGAEPVRKQTLDRFAAAFASCGFSPAALCPAYGLAEATLKVTTSRRNHEPTYFRASSEALGRGRIAEAAEFDSDATALVGCGAPGPGTTVLIVDPDTFTPCAVDAVGEIWVESASVAKGYWNQSEESAAVFHASRAEHTAEGHFMRTGDLGFMRGGELFVTGRIKDLVIIRGRNHYPHDIELTVQNSHPALRVDSGAAVSVDLDGEERLIVIQEIDRHLHRDAEDAVAAIRTAVTDQHDIAPYAVVLVRQNGVAKTSSGKIQRGACARAFIDGRLPVVHEWRERPVIVDSAEEEIETRSQEDIEAFLSQRLACSLSISPLEVDVTQPFNAIGLDSLRAITLLEEIEVWLGRKLSPTLFWNYPTVADLSAHLFRMLSDGSAAGDGRN